VLTDEYALDCPDDTLASLSCLNTLMSFSWSSPVAPETTLILQNDLPLDEQLIASLPETPGLRFRVRKEAAAAGSESDVTKCKDVDECRLDESLQQVCMLLFCLLFIIYQIWQKQFFNSHFMCNHHKQNC